MFWKIFWLAVVILGALYVNVVGKDKVDPGLKFWLNIIFGAIAINGWFLKY